MEFIKLQKNDIKKGLELVWEVFKEFEASEYSQQGIDEFRKFISYNDIIEKFNKGKINFWGCTSNDELIGVIATRDINHICLLFVNKKYHRRGIAKSLFEMVKNECENQDNLSKITVNSSTYAIEVYHQLGFLDIDKEQILNGIRFTPMEYLIK